MRGWEWAPGRGPGFEAEEECLLEWRVEERAGESPQPPLLR